MGGMYPNRKSESGRCPTAVPPRNPRWGGFLGGTAVGQRPDSDFLFGYIPPIYSAAGYARLDLGGWYAIGHHVTAYANVNNALNNHYNEVLGYPALRTNFRAGMRFSFGGE